MTRSLVTGAAGFVGANLTRRLLQQGGAVHLLLRPGRDRWRIADLADQVQIHDADLADREAVRRVLREARPEQVFHLAAYGTYSTQQDPECMVRTNLLGTTTLLDASADAGVAAFVYTGSSSEYGFKRTPASESDLLAPNSQYAITKAAATHYCQHLARHRDLHAVTLRLYSIYGPWEDRSRLMPVLLTHALRGGWPSLAASASAHDFVYVDDAVDAILTAASRRSVPRGAVYNVCTGVETSLADVVTEIRQILDVRAAPQWDTMPARSWDTDRWVGAPDAIARDLGWRAVTALRAGLQSTIAWLQADAGRLEYYAWRASEPPTPS